MQLTKLIIGGFKSIKEPVEIPLAPITLMFGPNSAGKSTIKDALQELKKRIAPQPNTGRSGLKGFSAWLTQDRHAHLCALSEEYESEHTNEEMETTNILLGCEFDRFAAEESITSENPGAAGRQAGLEIYFELNGKPIQFIFSDRGEGLTGIYALEADGIELCSYVSSGQVTADPETPALSPGNYRFLRNAQFFGQLAVNLDHPAWSATETSELFKKLRRDLSRTTDSWINAAAQFRGNRLFLRVPCTGRRVSGWIQSSDLDLYNNQPTSPEFARIDARVEHVCQIINELILQTEHRLSQHLDVTLVPGSRQLLSPSDVDTGWYAPYGARQFVPGSVMDYTAWLGSACITQDAEKSDLVARQSKPLDFVNEAFARQMFSARRYQIRPEVDVRQEKTILSRLSDEEVEGTSTTLRVNLFLRDEQGRSLDFHQVGSGISYVLPVLTALWGADRSWIEQPELHLHPSAQCEMGDAVIRAFNRGRFSVIETHSEHLLLRLLRRIRQTSRQDDRLDSELRCQPEAVSVLYFEPLPDGSTSVRQLRVSRGGDFMDRWPGGFFAEREQELFDE